MFTSGLDYDRIRLRKAMAMMSIVVLFSIVTAYNDDFYDSIFRGNLSDWDRRELRNICGLHNLSDTLTPIHSRSLGGNLVKDEEYPWALVLTDAWWTKTCSAVLISRRHVLTAAHCVTINTTKAEAPIGNCTYTIMKESSIYVYPRTRVTDVTKIKKFTSSYRVVNVTVHPNYDPCTVTGDIALLEISPNMLSEGSPICMPRSNESIPKNITSAGYGINPHLIGGARPLQTLKLNYSHNENETIVSYGFGRSICPGDSGGSLFKKNGTKYILLGITSAYHSCKHTDRNLTSWFESVIPKLDWICKNSGVCPQ